jgi:hypothetical protein
MEVITEETNSLYGTNIKTQSSRIIYIGGNYSFMTSAVIMEINKSVRSILHPGHSGKLLETSFSKAEGDPESKILGSERSPPDHHNHGSYLWV